MAKSPTASVCLVKNIYCNKCSLFAFRDDHLCNTFAILNNKIFIREIDQDDTYFATVISINSHRSIEYCKYPLKSQYTKRSDLCLVTCRKRKIKTGRYQSTFERFQGNRFIKVCTQIHACALFRGILR